MHETRFVNEIISVLKANLDKGVSERKISVNVRLSPFSHVTPEGLQESFKVLSEGENFKNVRLKVLPLEIALDCKSCKRSSQITKRVFSCPFCNSMDVNIQMGKEFFVESIEKGAERRGVKNGN